MEKAAENRVTAVFVDSVFENAWLENRMDAAQPRKNKFNAILDGFIIINVWVGRVVIEGKVMGIVWKNVTGRTWQTEGKNASYPGADTEGSHATRDRVTHYN